MPEGGVSKGLSRRGLLGMFAGAAALPASIASVAKPPPASGLKMDAALLAGSQRSVDPPVWVLGDDRMLSAVRVPSYWLIERPRS